MKKKIKDCRKPGGVVRKSFSIGWNLAWFNWTGDVYIGEEFSNKAYNPYVSTAISTSY